VLFRNRLGMEKIALQLDGRERREIAEEPNDG